MAAARQTALVTGASSGIGRDLARLFANAGYNLVLTARRADRIDELGAALARQHGITAATFTTDLSQPEAPHRLHAMTQERSIDVDVLVNNAGFGLRGRFTALPLERQSAMIRLNVEALTTLCRLYLPAMVERARGGILNVASTAAFQPGPLMAVYYATKAFVLSLTEALAEEHAGSGLRISCLCPGPTHTEFSDVAGQRSARLSALGVMTSEDVARAGFEGWRAGRVIVVPGARNRAATLAVRVAPRAAVRRLVRRMQQ